MKLSVKSLKNLSLGLTLIMSTSFVGCAKTDDNKNTSSHTFLSSNSDVEIYISPEGMVYESEEEYLRVANFDKSYEDLQKEAEEKNIELKDIEYFPSYNFDAEINDISFVSYYLESKNEKKPVYSYSVNSYDPNILQVFNNYKRVCVEHGNGIWKINGEEVEDENGKIFLVYPDYELVEFDGKVYVAPIKSTAQTNLQGIQDCINNCKVKKIS